jgi:GNAT superfamily N-acetyltransferase
MKYTIRKSRESDAEKIVSLFVSQGQNPHGWSEEKWYHFYRDYPENKSFGFVAEKSGNIVGHYGVAECRIGPLRAAVGMHAFIDPAFRGLELIRAILSEIETELSHRGVDILTAFSNKSFSLVKEKFLGWEYPFDLSFRKIAKLFKKDIDEKPYKFNFPSGGLARCVIIILVDTFTKIGLYRNS